jgi:hypothetical protein
MIQWASASPEPLVEVSLRDARRPTARELEDRCPWIELTPQIYNSRVWGMWVYYAYAAKAWLAQARLG